MKTARRRGCAGGDAGTSALISETPRRKARICIEDTRHWMQSDRMLDIWLHSRHYFRRVLAKLPAKRRICCSATFSDDIKALSPKAAGRKPEIEVARRNTSPEQAHAARALCRCNGTVVADDWPWQLAAGVGLHPHQAWREPSGGTV